MTVHLDRYHPDARMRQMYVCPACNVRREGTFPGRVLQVIRRWESPPVTILKRYNPNQGPEPLGVLWTVKRDPVSMTCALATHALGWSSA